MKDLKANRIQGTYLVIGAIAVASFYYFFQNLMFQNGTQTVFGTVFNAASMGLILYFVLKDEFLNWFKHFSFKWIIIGLPVALIVATLLGILWVSLGGHAAENSIDSAISWKFLAVNVPFMLMGEELLSIGLLYGLWKKWHWSFWQASLMTAFLFATWHLSSYGYNLLQCLVLLMPTRLILNQLFKKTNSIWVVFIVHFLFDAITMLSDLIK